jgi:hypothetical protein
MLFDFAWTESDMFEELSLFPGNVDTCAWQMSERLVVEYLHGKTHLAPRGYLVAVHRSGPKRTCNEDLFLKRHTALLSTSLRSHTAV